MAGRMKLDDEMWVWTRSTASPTASTDSGSKLRRRLCSPHSSTRLLSHPNAHWNYGDAVERVLTVAQIWIFRAKVGVIIHLTLAVLRSCPCLCWRFFSQGNMSGERKMRSSLWARRLGVASIL